MGPFRIRRELQMEFTEKEKLRKYSVTEPKMNNLTINTLLPRDQVLIFLNGTEIVNDRFSLTVQWKDTLFLYKILLKIQRRWRTI